MSEVAVAYRKKILEIIQSHAQPLSSVLAMWEGGSAATGTLDQYSDIDLCLLTDGLQQDILDQIQTCLEKKVGVAHTWQTAKSFWGEGLKQRVMVLKDSPKFFFVDVGVFSTAHPQLLQEFLEVERHGHQLVYFDKVGAVRPLNTDAETLFKKQQARVTELSAGLPIFVSLVEKELQRGQFIDALAFYQNGVLRPTIEVMGMIHRPYKYDFGMRYLHRHFPEEARQLVYQLSYISGPDALIKELQTAKATFAQYAQQVKSRLSIEN